MSYEKQFSDDEDGCRDDRLKSDVRWEGAVYSNADDNPIAGDSRLGYNIGMDMSDGSGVDGDELDFNDPEYEI